MTLLTADIINKNVPVFKKKMSNDDIFRYAIKNKISGGNIKKLSNPMKLINNEEIKKNYNSDFRLRGGEIPYSHNFSPIRQNINLFTHPQDIFPNRNKILNINREILYNKKN